MSTENIGNLFAFTEESDDAQQDYAGHWRVLVVDDDACVHEATQLAVSNLIIQNRAIELISAYSAIEATRVLGEESDIAVILLDVVMETEDAGLRLVRTIRQDLKLLDVRIILRTGQPGQAPEVDVIRTYDINDYRSKAELTHTKLFTALTSAIRSYEHIQMLHSSRDGLSMVIRSSSELMALSGMQEFARGVILQITALLGLDPEGLLCAEAPEGGIAQIIAAAGNFGSLTNRRLVEIPDKRIRSSIEQALALQRSDFTANGAALYIACRSNHHLVAYIQTQRMFKELDIQLLEVFCTNISIGFENVELFSRLREAAYVDLLTRLPNRMALADKIPQIGSGTLVMLDIDNFSEINDALGFEYGNLLLKAIAHRLRSAFPDDICVARAGGDLFALCGAQVSLSQALAAVTEAFDISGNEITVSASIGSFDFANNSNGHECLQAAGIALRQAKLRRRGSAVSYADEMGAAARERVQLLQELRQAIREQRLSLAYQPQEILGDAGFIGVEALLRWQKADGSFVPPDRFISLAESTGLIVQIGEWVLHTAVRDMNAMQARTGRPARVSVNVSATQFEHAALFPCLEHALTELNDGLELEIEITESVAMSDPIFFAEMIARVKDMGIRVAIDDFGTGYSSLSYLQDLNVDRLKVDRSFVRKMTDERGRRIVQAIVQMGKTLNLCVIAEGIETAEEREMLIALGCDEGQGYLYGKPMFLPQLEAWVSRQAGVATAS